MKTAIYVRVSTEEQSVEMQTQAISIFLKNKGISDYQIYADEGISGTSESRPALNQLLFDCKQGKVELLVVYKLDRLFRSLSHLISTLKTFDNLNIKFIAIQDQIDMTTPAGRLQFHIIGAFAQFERDLISQRTKSGLANARARGVQLGRQSMINQHMLDSVIQLKAKNKSYREIAELLDISLGTVQNCIKRAKVSKLGAEE